jgi:DNA-binding response OmpR family regulator
VKRLRAKIEREPHNPEYLVTVRGLGYRFIDQPYGERRPHVVAV